MGQDSTAKHIADQEFANFMNIPKTDTQTSTVTSNSGQDQTASVLDITSAEQRAQIVSISDRIRGVILQRISDGTYMPGERLKELALAHEFKVSQAPVREAFRSLESLGVLVSEHYRGTHVRAISERETEEVYQLRGHLEEIAAQLIPVPELEQNIAVIDALQMDMRAAALTGDMEGYAHANVQFHRSIVSLAPNQILLKVWDSLEIAMRSRMNLQRNERKLSSLAEIHQPIVDALKHADLQRAGILLREHSFSFLQALP
jgi:DNA-binding GntR family transcriptional regulator